MTDSPRSDPAHPHEPEIAPALDTEGRCLVCVLIVERDEARALAMRGYRSMVGNTLPSSRWPQDVWTFIRSVEEAGFHRQEPMA